MAFDSPPSNPRQLFLWIPGQGPDGEALARLCDAFPKPAEPMGEAWFMGDDRLMFPELAGDLSRMSFEDLERPLDEMVTGPTCHGQLEEWTDWFHYLMPRLLPRGHESAIWTSLLEILVTGFFSQHPNTDAPEPYPGFRRDALETLGRGLMGPECWPGGRVDYRTCLDKGYVERVNRWFWEDTSGKLSCSLFFCLKYLPPEEVGPWLTSVLAIRSTHWRAQLMVWFLGAHEILCGAVNQPGELPDEACPSVSWWSSHWLKGNYTGDYSGRCADAIFLPERNRTTALEAVRRYLTEPTFESWLSSLSRYDYLERELGDFPFDFWKLYGR